ncbi:cyclin-D1-1-like isoform X2 [Fagus crenata]
MSMSPILYCNEVATDVVSSNADICDHDFHATLDFLSDYESSIISVFDSEMDQMLELESIHRLRGNPGIVSARKDAVNWMLKVHAYYQFRPETAYLSVNYLDRFLSSHTLPKGKGWPLQLLSVACLALAAKMEETSVPLLIDLQVKEPRFLFKPKTVQRMELLVMANLKWRLHRTTPFDFVHYFIAKLSCLGSPLNDCSHVLSHASDLIISTCQMIDFLDYPPSSIAAAAVLCATDQYVDDQELGYFHKRELVKNCYNLMKQTKCLLAHVKQQKLQPLPPSTVGVPDAAIGRSYNIHKIGLTRT